MAGKFSNRLINESSPYLLQHAHNPVDWFPWSEEALEKARKEDKPILVSIGYSACHWCHVMERESFENEATARLMNELFINIKIDREERPDLDHIYMDAVQAMTGAGGWPLNVFLTPDARPFYGGTYFPPRRAYNRPSWEETIRAVAAAFMEKRDEIDAQAGNLTEHLLKASSFAMQDGKTTGSLGKSTGDEIFAAIMKTADTEWGGFGHAPKFPQTFIIQFLLRYHHLTKNADALKQACLSLDKMIAGGIYDQAGGGFSRYSTDTEWLAPHFEKMLYDNALLVSVLSEAFQLTGRLRYREVIGETIDFLQRELMHPAGGFYAALDADSEGEEGKFYVWARNEVEALLSADAEVFCQYYDITEGGNWEGKNIPRVLQEPEAFAAARDLKVGELRELLAAGRQKLMEARSLRPRPLLDDKIILGWNALMNTALSKAFAATDEERYRELAKKNMNFILDKLGSGGHPPFSHTWKNEEARHPAFLDDYAYLVRAMIDLQEITGEADWLLQARGFCDWVMGEFGENDPGYLFYTRQGQQDVIIRKKEIYDGAVPSGNAIMAYNLHHLSILFDRPEWRELSGQMVGGLGSLIVRYPGSFGVWACLLQELVWQTDEIAIIGPNHLDMLKEVLRTYLPQRVLMASAEGDSRFPLTAGKTATGVAAIYLCKNFSCSNAVFTCEELLYLKSLENS